MIGTTWEQGLVSRLKSRTTTFLRELTAIRSYSNEETEACAYCAEAFAAIPGVEARRLPLTNALREHPLYCPGPGEQGDYTGHFNVEVVWRGSGEQLPVYLNAHIDTVPAGQDVQLLEPVLEGDLLYGLGACDDKGSIASIFALFLLLSHQGQALPFDVIGHIVVEEEIGGNGALAISDPELGRRLEGQAAVVMEPTNGNIFPVARCGLWMKVVAHGSGAHTAAIGTGRGESALTLLLKALEVTRAAHQQYREECAQNPVRYYEGYLPPFNIGTLHAGDYPSKVAPVAEAVVSVAVLPNSTNAAMKARLLAAVAADPALKGQVELRFVFDRDSCVTDFDDPYVQRFARYVRGYGYSGQVESMKALCDMYFYKVISGIPCVTFGPGDLLDTHCAGEKVDLNDVIKCAFVLYDWMQDGNFCSLEEGCG